MLKFIALENEADRIYRTALESYSPIQQMKTDELDLIKWREIYENLETVTDKCEDVANILEVWSIKYA